MVEKMFLTEEIELPSKGLIYEENNPLRSGKIEIKYMTAKEEDILSNQSYIEKGIVLDKLLESLIVNKKIKVDDLIVGDKNALFIASRVLGYGKNYEFDVGGESQVIDLTTLENKEFDETSITLGLNSFSFTLPSTGVEIKYKLLTGKDEKAITRELEGLKKLNPNESPELTTRLKHMILSVEENSEPKHIREFVDNRFLAMDSRAFRGHIKQTQPDVNLTYISNKGKEVSLPIGLNFFWPDY